MTPIEDLELEKKIVKLYVEENNSLMKISKEIKHATSYVARILKNKGVYKTSEKEEYKMTETIYYIKSSPEIEKQYIEDIKLNLIRFKDSKTEFCKETLERFPKEEGFIYIAKCKTTGKLFLDIENRAGGLTTHIKKLYPKLILPSTYCLRGYYAKNNKNWYEDFMDIIKINDPLSGTEFKKCKYCPWDTVDTKNLSGWYGIHLEKEHNKSVKDYIIEFPEEESYFKVLLAEKAEKEFLSKQENFVECKICGEKMRQINNTHLQKHNISNYEYISLYGETVSDTTSKLLGVALSNNNFMISSNNVYSKDRRTDIEALTENKLMEIGFDIKFQQRIGNWFYDFLLKDYGLFIETDGFYWHGHDRQSNWDIRVFQNLITDVLKSKRAKHIVRLVGGTSINNKNYNQIETVDSFFNFLEKENFEIKNHKAFHLNENEIIFSKEYCINNQEYFKEKNTASDLLFLIKNFYPLEEYKDISDYRLKIGIINVLGLGKTGECFDVNIKNTQSKIKEYLNKKKLVSVGFT